MAELARGTGVLWVERTKFELFTETEGAAADTSAVGELGRLIDQIRSEPAFTSEFRASLETVLAEIPTGRRSSMIPDETAAEELTNSLLEGGAAAVLAAMKGASE